MSSTDAILRAIDQTKVIAVVSLDMSQAFDSIKHEILLTSARLKLKFSYCDQINFNEPALRPVTPE